MAKIVNAVGPGKGSITAYTKPVALLMVRSGFVVTSVEVRERLDGVD
jgi:hypothetical protein